MSVASPTGEWQFTVNPRWAWVPTNIAIEVEEPSTLPAGMAAVAAGAGAAVKWAARSRQALRWRRAGRLPATNGTWRFDFDGVYAAVGGDRRRRSSTSTST